MSRKIEIQKWQQLLNDNSIQADILSESHRGKHRRFLMRCRICNQEFERDACKDSILRSCWYCNGKAPIPNETDIATKAAWMIPYLKDKTIAYKFKPGSNYRTIFKCPDCGYEKDLSIKDVTTYGFKCSVCNDKLTKPNKFLRALLKQLPVDNIIYEYHSEWTKNRKYDVYFEIDHKKYIIEMDGDQHRLNTTWSTLERQNAIDKEKEKLAYDNGVHLIRIKAKIYDYESWIEQFKSCEIGNFIKDSDVDWNKCIEYAESNLTKEMCDYINSNPDATLKDVSEEFGICRNTASAYLKIGTKLGWCNFTKEDAKNRSDRFNAKRKGVRNRLYDKDGTLISEFYSFTECAKTISSLCGITVTYENIRSKFRRKKKNVANIYGYCVEIAPY